MEALHPGNLGQQCQAALSRCQQYCAAARQPLEDVAALASQGAQGRAPWPAALDPGPSGGSAAPPLAQQAAAPEVNPSGHGIRLQLPSQGSIGLSLPLDGHGTIPSSPLLAFGRADAPGEAAAQQQQQQQPTQDAIASPSAAEVQLDQLQQQSGADVPAPEVGRTGGALNSLLTRGGQRGAMAGAAPVEPLQRTPGEAEVEMVRMWMLTGGAMPLVVPCAVRHDTVVGRVSLPCCQHLQPPPSTCCCCPAGGFGGQHSPCGAGPEPCGKGAAVQGTGTAAAAAACAGRAHAAPRPGSGRR